ncbi:hypothetical protein GCM10010442_71330 [Kitasatospora kifunensis]|uniref:Acetyltransferase n=1 Tax=Kitasatospora kifunensis TaxID=58351 RepID=A0A7W7R7M2_KITKI|nr:hypothetical protein [Kitasatospora kifunensis]
MPRSTGRSSSSDRTNSETSSSRSPNGSPPLPAEPDVAVHCRGRAALRAAEELGERFVVVLGHPAYYPRFGFGRASGYGIGLAIDVPDEAVMALALDADHPLPSGTVRYAAPFGI